MWQERSWTDVKLSTMLRATGGQLRSFLNITLTESSTYEELRSVIARWDALQTKWQNPLSAAFGPDSNKNGVADMEIDRVGEYKGGKKGKGKGKAKEREANLASMITISRTRAATAKGKEKERMEKAMKEKESQAATTTTVCIAASQDTGDEIAGSFNVISNRASGVQNSR